MHLLKECYDNMQLRQWLFSLVDGFVAFTNCTVPFRNIDDGRGYCISMSENQLTLCL